MSLKVTKRIKNPFIARDFSCKNFAIEEQTFFKTFYFFGPSIENKQFFPKNHSKPPRLISNVPSLR